MTRYRLSSFVLLSLATSLVVGDAAGEQVSICHVPPGDPANAHVIHVGRAAVDAHVRRHGDAVVPDDPSCTAGVGECAADGLLQCTAAGLVCDASPLDPPEVVETSCADGLDNDCDGSIDAADADCVPVCPDTSGLRAAITRQIESLDDCTVAVQIATLTDRPVRLVAQSVDTPDGVLVDSLQTSSCTAQATTFVCRHDMVFDYTGPTSFDGSYVLYLDDECDPFLSCPLCLEGVEMIPFSLAGASCDVTEVPPPELGTISGALWFDTDGDGVRDPGEPDLALAATLELFADEAPFDGQPDGAPVASQTLSGDPVSSYTFSNVPGGIYVVGLTGPAGTCPSSGPDSAIDPSTGVSFPVSIVETSPPTMVTDVDLALKDCP